MPLRCALYARYSSDLQSRASIEDQLRLCAARADREGWTVVGSFHDAAISGATTLRPGYQGLLEAMRTGKMDVVLAESLDRFSRDLEHVAAFYKKVTFSRVRLVTLAEGEISELHVGLKGTMGALYLKDLADKTRRGLVGRIQKGRAVGRVPYGYRAIRGVLGPDGEPERGLREIDPVECEVVRRIFRDYAAGASTRTIARALNAEGVASPNGEDWSDSSIRGRPSTGAGLLRAAIYVGRLIWNRHRTLTHPETGRRHYAPNDAAAVAVSDVLELRIVEPEIWEAVQARLARHQPSADGQGRPRFWDERRPKHLLTGKVVCGCCGRTFEAIGKDYLTCRGVRRKSCRNNVRVRRAHLERDVLTALGTRLMEPRLAQAFAEAFQQEWNRLAAADAAAHADRRGELPQVERRIAHVVEALADGTGSSRALRAKLAELEAQRDELEAAAAAQPARQLRLHPDVGQVYRERVHRMHETITGGRCPEAVEAARALVDRVIVPPRPDGGGRPEPELVGDLREMLRMGGITGLSRGPDAAEVDPVDVAICSAKERMGGGKAPSAFGTSSRTFHDPHLRLRGRRHRQPPRHPCRPWRGGGVRHRPRPASGGDEGERHHAARA